MYAYICMMHTCISTGGGGGGDGVLVSWKYVTNRKCNSSYSSLLLG